MLKKRLPFPWLNVRTRRRDLGSQTQITPSSDPEIKRFPSAQYAKQVTALLKQKKKSYDQELLQANNAHKTSHKNHTRG